MLCWAVVQIQLAMLCCDMPRAVLCCAVAVPVQALQAELFLEVVGQESIPWTMAWTL